MPSQSLQSQSLQSETRRLADGRNETCRGPGDGQTAATRRLAVRDGSLLVAAGLSAQGSVAERAWQLQANCMGVDPDLFFPERGASTREAKEVCRGCVVRDACLEYALVHAEKFGIWGGLSERERRRIRRRRSVERSGELAGGAAS
jgi:WhiB family redox-sensing transcriptional regulator